MKQTFFVQWLFILTTMPLCAQEQYLEIDTTIVFNKDRFHLEQHSRKIQGQEYFTNHIYHDNVGYSTGEDYPSNPAPVLPWFAIRISLDEEYDWDVVDVSFENRNLMSVGYRLIPGYYTVWNWPQERKDSLFLAAYDYKYKYDSYPEKLAQPFSISPSQFDGLKPINYNAIVNVTPFSYDTAQDIIFFHPRIHLHLRFIKKGTADVSSPIVNHQSSNHQSFDLSGRRLSVPSATSVGSVLPKGVYIENGKKRVRK